MELVIVMFEFILLGIAGGLLGIFYRNCLKPRGMIFNWWYYKVLKPWVELEDDLKEAGIEYELTFFDRVKAFIAMPLGYCIYCSTTWITFFIIAIYLSAWEVLPDWQTIVIGTIMASGVQHIVVACACRWLINKHPDLDTHES